MGNLRKEKTKKFFRIALVFSLIFLPVFLINFLLFALAWNAPVDSPDEMQVKLLSNTSETQFKEGALGVGGVLKAFVIQLSPYGGDQPSCNENTRGMIWSEEGEEEDGEYAWKRVSFDPCGGLFTLDDVRDGNSYNIVEIGDQCWMSENLSYLPFVEGSSRGGPNLAYYYVYDYEETDLSSAKSSENYKNYGVLYNWYAAMSGENKEGSQGVCPEGWHLPTDSDWHILEKNLSRTTCDDARSGYDCDPAGELMKTKEWGGVENSLFKALPGGFRNSEGKFSNLESHGYFWSSSSSDDLALRRYLDTESPTIARFPGEKDEGLSVRCIRD